MKHIVNKIISVLLVMMVFCSAMTMISYADQQETVVINNGVLTECIVSNKIYTIPTNVNEIAENAFGNCPNLEEIVIGNNVRIIGSGAFTSCTNLKLIGIFGTNAITVMNNIADKNAVLFLINNQNTSVRKSIAMNGYNWCTFENYSASGNNVLSFIYGLSRENAVKFESILGLVDTYHPDYVYFENDNAYYLSKGRTSTEVDFTAKVNPGFFTKFNINMAMNKLPDKTDINNGNDRAKNSWLKLFNALVKAFS